MKRGLNKAEKLELTTKIHLINGLKVFGKKGRKDKDILKLQERVRELKLKELGI